MTAKGNAIFTARIKTFPYATFVPFGALGVHLAIGREFIFTLCVAFAKAQR
jgi:hypothetical protein